MGVKKANEARATGHNDGTGADGDNAGRTAPTEGTIENRVRTIISQRSTHPDLTSEKVRRALKAAGENGLTTAELANAAGAGVIPVRMCVQRMRAAGLVTSTKVRSGVYGTKANLWRWVEA